MKRKRKSNNELSPSDIERFGQPVADGVILLPSEVCTDPIRFTTFLSVVCRPEIGRHFYFGDALLQVNENTPPAELFAIGADLDYDEKDGVLPSLKAHIGTLVGESLLPFVFCEIGQNSIILSWTIHSDVFDATAKKVLDWIKYAELEEIITVEEGRLW